MEETNQSAQAIRGISGISGDVRTIEAVTDGKALRTLVRTVLEIGPLEQALAEEISKEFERFYDRILELVYT